MATDKLNVEYVRIDGGHYGGNQIWWGRDSIGNAYGCGVIAATDFVLVMAPTKAFFYEAYNITSLPVDKKAYMRLADALWSCVGPNTGLKRINPYDPYKRGGIGVYTIGKFVGGIRRFGKEQGWVVVDHRISNIESIWNKKNAYIKALDFLKAHLKKGRPIQLLSWHQLEPYSFHWITITEMNEKSKDNQCEITIATWGEKRKILDFEKFWQYDQMFSIKYMVALEIRTT